jgi:hypothetical protein
MFRSFLFDHPQGAIYRALCRYYTVFHWFAFVEYLYGMWLYVYIFSHTLIGKSGFLPIKCFTSHILDIMGYMDFILTELLYYRWYTHTATYHVNIQRTQISGRHYNNGTKHGIWPPEDCRIKRTETCRGLIVFTNMF